MRFKRPLDGLLSSQTSTRVLRVLARSPEKSYTSRELALAAGAPAHRVLEVLARLEHEGVARSRVVGRAYFWTPNREHPLLPLLEALFDGEAMASAALRDLIGKHLSGTPGLMRVVLFGSAARGEEHSGSDLDLLVLMEGAIAKGSLDGRLARLQAEAYERFGSRIRPIVYTAREYARRRGTPLVRAIEREGEPIQVRGVGR